ncbi:MAG TPA: DUF4124 domain-containing protein [Gammaproteobacteria bacterium]|jgi:hypothetical protein
MNKVAFICGMMLALGTSLAAADQVYRWVDPQGNVHFSQTPPPGTKTQAQPMTVYVPPPDPQSLQNTQQSEQAQADKDKAAADAAAKKPDPAAEAQKKAHCDDLRQRLVILQQSGRAATTDAKGNLTYLDDDARAKQEAAIQDQINKDCSGGGK